MGGSGSTRWGAHYKKHVVEKCMNLDVKAFRLPNGQQSLQQTNATGILKWDDGIAIEYSIEDDVNGLALKLLYSVQGFRSSEFKKPSIHITSTKCNYGGQRYWFHCPQCQRRSAVLYLLKGDFACRQCHHLTYTSSQKAHQSERLLCKLDALLHSPKSFI